MQFPKFLLRQLARPAGWFAPITAFLINRNNKVQNARAIEILAPAPHHKVLDIGFGGGISFKELLRTSPEGQVAGIDHADTMVTRARQIWAREIEAGRMQIEQGSVYELPWKDGSFDRVLTVNTVYFWADLEAALREALRVLAPGGVFASSVLPAETLRGWGYTSMDFRAETPDFYADALRAAGFDEVAVHETGDRGKSAVIRGTRP